MKEEKNFIIKTYSKGILMGTCDLIPGISGGTIAFITGIYERLINAITQFTPKTKIQFISALLKKDKKNITFILQKLDLIFLIILFSGIGTAIILGSHIISYLLENYETFLLVFFIGLILASTKMIYNQIEKKHSINNSIFAAIGFIIGTLMIFLTPQNLTNPSPSYILLGGFLAITAMFLPGISGSFILLIMGLYEFIINSVSNLTTQYKTILIFGIGAIAGVIIISRIIKFFLTKYHSKTLYTLLGFVLGSLSIPLTKVWQSPQFTISNLIYLIPLFILGILMIIIIDKYLN